MTFRVGQEVVCVDAGKANDEPWREWMGDVPIKNAIYTIIGIQDFMADGLGLRLAEISNTKIWDGCYAAWRFRPVIKRSTETGVAILKKVAADASKNRETVE